jgi:hypothetical protein
VKLATANTLQFIVFSISALPGFRSPWADLERIACFCSAHRSARGVSVDWQTWGTKRGLCWQATRDGLRHVPAGPPKSLSRENPSALASKDTRRPRLSARRAPIPAEYMSTGIQMTTTRITALLIRNSLLRRAPSAGAGKNALPLPARSLRGERAGGEGWGWVCPPDSHALSNTWESVQKLGLMRKGVGFEVHV